MTHKIIHFLLLLWIAAAIRTQKDVLSRGRKSEYQGPNASPKGAAHEVFSLREAVHGGREHAHSGAGVSHMWLQHTDEETGRTALRSEVTGHHRAAHLSRQTIRTDAVTKTCGRTTARRNNNVMKANSGKVQKRGSESHVISGGLLRHSLETRTRMFRGTRQFSIWNGRALCNSSWGCLHILGKIHSIRPSDL